MIACKATDSLARMGREQLLNCILQSATDYAIISISLDGRLRTWNAGAHELFGYQEWEVLDRPCSILYTPEDRAAEVPATLHRTALETGRARDDRWHIRKDGTRFFVNAVITPLYDPERQPVGLLKITVDGTGQKLLEEELLEMHKSLHARVQERTQQLEALHRRQRCVERMAALGALAAGVGHDLINLILPLRVQLSLLLRTNLPPGAAETVEKLRSTIEYLQRLAAGMRLMLRDSSARAASIEMTTLKTWWPEIEGLLCCATPKNVRVLGDIPADLPPVKISPVNLTQVVFNLVYNAGQAMCDYRRSDGESCRVVIRAREAAASIGLSLGNCVELRVSDNGPGMSDEQARQCFDQYYSTNTQGTNIGLGLWIVKTELDGAGARISVRTALGEGTDFIMELPTVPAQDQSSIMRHS